MTKRKLVAIVLALAMILSTFGTLPVFAEDAAATTVSVDKDYIATGVATAVKATIKDQWGKVFDDDVDWALYQDVVDADHLVDSDTTDTGYINLSINATTDSGAEYIVVINDDEDVSATVTTKHDLDLSSSTAIKVGENKIISGTFKVGNGDDPEDVTKAYLYIGSYLNDDEDRLEGVPVGFVPKSTPLSTSGAFAFAVSFKDATDWAITLATGNGAVVYASGTVSPDKTLDVSVDTDTVKTNAPEKIEVTVEDDGDPVQGAVVVVTDVTLEDDDVPAVTPGANGYTVGSAAAGSAAAIGLLSDDGTFYGVTDKDGIVNFEATYIKSGTAKIVAYYEESNDTPSLATVAGMDTDEDDIADFAWDNSGEASFKVAAADAFNASIDAEDLVVGEEDTVTVKIWDSKGAMDIPTDTVAAKKGIKKAEVTLSGCGIDESADIEDDEYTADGTFEFDVTPENGGVLKATIKVTFGDDSTDTMVKEADIDGWQVTVTPTSLAIDKEYNFKAVVTDEDGKVVNRAVVAFGIEDADSYDADDDQLVSDMKYVDDGKWEDWDEPYISAATTNINDGVYAETVKFANAEKIRVGVYNIDNELMAYKDMEVFGDDVYDVTLDPGTLVAGLAEELDITAKDAAGDEIDLEGADDIHILIDGEEYSDWAYEDDAYKIGADSVGDDGGDMAFEAGSYEVIFKNHDGSEIGKATLKVVDPKVELGLADALTDSMMEEMNIKVTDPRDGSAMDNAFIEFEATGAFYKVFDDEDAANDEDIFTKDAEGEPEYTNDDDEVSEDGLDIYVMAWDDSDNDDDAPVVDVKVFFDAALEDDASTVASLAVKPIAITATPDKVAVDATTTVTLSVKDAHGVGLDSVNVELTGPVSAESQTDANGNVTFVLKPSATGTIKAKVETDRDDEYADGKFQAVISGATGTVSIKVQVGNSNAVVNGKIVSLDVTPIIENGRTLMPFRFVGENTGAKVAWIAATNEVTYEYAGTKIVLKIGSDIATVTKADGTTYTVKLDVPVKVVNGRTLVPVRFISETLGCYVDWDFATNAITITR